MDNYNAQQKIKPEWQSHGLTEASASSGPELAGATIYIEALIKRESGRAKEMALRAR